MRDHWWWRPGWRVGRRAYTFHITFDDETAASGVADLHRFVSAYQAALAAVPGLDMVPLRWLHLTMQNVGFTDEVDQQELDAVLAGARERCAVLRPFELTFREVEVRGEGVAIRPQPADLVSQMREAARDAIGAVLGTVPEAPEHARGFEPHVSVAYSNADGHARPLLHAIDGVRTAPAVVRVRAAKLIVLDRDERVYRWTAYGTVPLGPAA